MARTTTVGGVLLVAWLAGGCERGGEGEVKLTGAVVGARAPAGTLGAAIVPLGAEVTAVALHGAGDEVADRRLSAKSGEFAFELEADDDYAVVFREGDRHGRTLAVLVADPGTGRSGFTLAGSEGERAVGPIVMDRERGKAWIVSGLALLEPGTPAPDGDGDGIPDKADSSSDEDLDGVIDGQDAFPFDGGETEDTDGDRVGDNADTDDDDDGVVDAEDALPKDPRDWLDSDGDGLGDRTDADDDNDGVPDAADAFPKNAAETADTDGDGVGNNADPDDDNDGVLDLDDALPEDASDSADNDGDGIGDGLDPDDDNDGFPDLFDALPYDPTESLDGDGDGIGDNADIDDDDDRVADEADAFPDDPNEWADADGDGIGDRADLDDDNDGVNDLFDAMPTNPAEWLDTDADNIGNNADPDDDNDGLLDAADPWPLISTPQSPVVPPPDLNPLSQIAIPEPPQLAMFVKSKFAAIRLGKALFWDMQVGSDGVQACATCHFQAGADPRMKNQLNPGTLAGDSIFGNNRGGGMDFPAFAPNYPLSATDFPLHVRAPPEDIVFLPILRDTNDVVSSQGVRLTLFQQMVPGSAMETVSVIPDPVFNLGGVNTRRVEPRNTPTVINAVFNFTNFWDGRASFLFNGENPFGPADPNAGVWFADPVQGLVKRPVVIQFASLASQAVGPPLSDFEMSARGRTFPMIGRKLLTLTPLGLQLVHPGDGVLGNLSNATLLPDGSVTDIKGLGTTYAEMIQAAFSNNLWSSSARTPQGFTQMEANFALFFGLAVQLYEATLVSDDTPFDRWLAGDAAALSDQQKFGFALFSGIANCSGCHTGVELTSASVATTAFLDNFDNATMELMFATNGSQVLYDTGYNNTGVTPNGDDPGRGGTMPFINPRTGQEYPLAFNRLAVLQKQSLLPFETPILPLFLPANIGLNADGNFKVPGLRNVALTPPYFHNGSALTLDQVLDFYARGGNFPDENRAQLDPQILGASLLLHGQNSLHAALVAFMHALTDARVAAESAPFDHPELFVPEGDPEVLIKIPARNASGAIAQP
ncbi:MAG: thrombospondin type 3 repeat-containing protein [Deltaproteobacteria bacterium]|nr:thrombospondin type 3 repeat-containing protein [Deltaproteobacteria bacterium]